MLYIFITPKILGPPRSGP